MRIVNQQSATTTTVSITVELATQEEGRDFMSYVRAYGKSGVLVEPDGRQRPVRNIEKTHPVDNVQELILTLADEVDGVTFTGLRNGVKELGYTISKNSLSSALTALKIKGKIKVIATAMNVQNHSVFVYQTVKLEGV